VSTAAKVDALMAALESEYGAVVRTPGGVSWLHSHHVPVRRLLTRLVKRLTDEVPFHGGEDERDLIVARHQPSLGYVTYDVSPAGMAYLLGTAAIEMPDDERPAAEEVADRALSPTAPKPVCAVSWSSRHAQTLLPVQAELARRGVASTVLDLATETRHAVPTPPDDAISVLRLPKELLARGGGPPVRALSGTRDGRTVQVGEYAVPVDRLAALVVGVLRRSADITQPSWAAAVGIERWLDDALSHLASPVLLCSNDTSPPGVLAVRAAERAGADTVYVQHGAWVEGQVAWRAQHCRHIAVMGARDVLTARTWSKRADAHVHVVGQPRFDVLTEVDRAAQRRYLEKVLAAQAGAVPPRIAVWACQPFREEKLRSHFEVVAEGLRRAGGTWSLVVAPHPAQGADAYSALLEDVGTVSVALADSAIGARGCLAGADALISASSTCGIEAMLLDVPVLELVLPATRTLGLADQRAAQRCAASPEITAALERIAEAPHACRVSAAAKRAICLDVGGSSAAVADVVVTALAEATARGTTALSGFAAADTKLGGTNR
jgi:hypothetical protein